MKGDILLYLFIAVAWFIAGYRVGLKGRKG